MELLKNINLAIRFFLELFLLGSLAYASFHLFENVVMKWLAVIGLPVLAATIWGIFIAPKAQHLLDQPARLLLEMLLFGFASFLLYKAGYPKAAISFIAVVAVNEALLYIWKQ